MIKSYFPGLASKISYLAGRFFSKVPISPVTWTLFSIVPALAGAYFLSQGNLGIGLILFLVAGALDLVDGAVARFNGKVTRFGAFLDGITDRFVEFLMILGLYIYKIPAFGISGELWLIALLSAGTFMTSFIPAYASHKKVIFEEEMQLIVGILERPERLIIIYAAMFAGLYDPVWLTRGIALATILAVVTVFQRLRFVAKHADR